MPTQALITEFLKRQMNRWEGKVGYQPSTIAKRLGRISFAEAEEFCETIRRRHILSRQETSLKSLVSEELGFWEKRVKAVRNGNRSKPTTS